MEQTAKQELMDRIDKCRNSAGRILTIRIYELILEDRIRICQPLINLPVGYRDESDRGDALMLRIEETLKAADLSSSQKE